MVCTFSSRGFDNSQHHTAYIVAYRTTSTMASSISQIKSGLILVLFMACNSLPDPLMKEKDMEFGIIPGDETTIVKPPHSHPWVVGLVDHRHGRIKCGGTLLKGVRRDYVLTAAHCVDPTYPNGFKVSHVIVGEHDQKNPYDGQQFVAVKNVKYHPKWRKMGTTDYDLAIIKLYSTISNPGARAINLPRVNDKFSKYIVDGWGSTGFGKGSDVLRTVDLDDIKSTDPWASKCRHLSIFRFDIHICGENLKNIERGTCGGDSGGPWVARARGMDILAGVHILGECSNHGVPHAAMRLSQRDIRKWIIKNRS